jgi:hypothetical protein
VTRVGSLGPENGLEDPAAERGDTDWPDKRRRTRAGDIGASTGELATMGLRKRRGLHAVVAGPLVALEGACRRRTAPAHPP